MSAIAVLGLKGGVGKTSLAVNLAWAAAAQSSRRTLLWDLDGQAAATFILRGHPPAGRTVSELLRDEASWRKFVGDTPWPRLRLLPADSSLHALDALFADLDRKKRVQRLAEEMARDFDRVIVDCPPGLGLIAEQVLRAATLVVVPLIPSALSLRAYAELAEKIAARSRRPEIVPVFSMVDRRRSVHRAVIADHPDWPVIPIASIVEQMAERRAPLSHYAPSCEAARSIRELWQSIEERLARRTSKTSP